MYFLYPSGNWHTEKGGWLTFTAENGGQPFDLSQTLRAVEGFHSFANPFDFEGGVRGNRKLAEEGAEGHKRVIDGFKTNGVDYRVVVGAGVETITAMKERPHTWLKWTDYSYGEGDGTVPFFSALQIKRNGEPLGEKVPRYYVCDIDHNALATDTGVFDGVAGFLRNGAPITLTPFDGGQRSTCKYNGDREVVVTSRGGTRTPIRIEPLEESPEPPRRKGRGRGQDLRVGTGSEGVAVRPQKFRGARGQMSLADAVQTGWVDVVERGERTVLVVSGDRPVRIITSGRELAAQVTPLGGDQEGSAVNWGPLNGQVAIDAGSRITASRGGKRLLSAAPDRRPPVTTVRRRRVGRYFQLTPRARDASGVRETYVKIGRRPPREWRGRIRVSARRIGSVRFGSVDVFGNEERRRRVVPR